MTALVTGGSKGIGRAVAIALADTSPRVLLTYRSDEAAAADACEEVKLRGADAIPLRFDLGDPQASLRLAEEIAEHTDGLDAVVHAAVHAYPAKLMELSAEAFDKAVRANGSALLHLVRELYLHELLRRGAGICLLTSRGSRVGIPNYAAIGPAKALAESLVVYLANELAPNQLRVNAVSAGAVRTEAVAQLFPDVDEWFEKAGERLPLGRAVTAEDVANAVSFLCSPAASMITGQQLRVDGGQAVRG